jgi:competence ComEA-like helix-hairpin-helix protein
VTRGLFACSAALAAALLGGLGSLAAVPGGACRPTAHLVPRHRIDIDRASAHEVALLTDVGPSLAARIVADRAARGPFASVDDLRRVRGVGDATLEGIRRDIHVADGPSDAAGASSDAVPPGLPRDRTPPRSRGRR